MEQRRLDSGEIAVIGLDLGARAFVADAAGDVLSDGVGMLPIASHHGIRIGLRLELLDGLAQRGHGLRRAARALVFRGGRVGRLLARGDGIGDLAAELADGLAEPGQHAARRAGDLDVAARRPVVHGRLVDGDLRHRRFPTSNKKPRGAGLDEHKDELWRTGKAAAVQRRRLFLQPRSALTVFVPIPRQHALQRRGLGHRHLGCDSSTSQWSTGRLGSYSTSISMTL